MLILGRRPGETIVITMDLGSDKEVNIRCAVLGVKGNQVRLGIDAPGNVTVHREEVYLRIKEEQK